MNADLRGLVDSIQESARLLGQVQARKEAGNYTEADSRFEVAMHKAIAADKARIELSVAQGQGWRLMGRMTIGGVEWSGPNPHDRDANPPGTRYCAAPAQPDGVRK